MRIYSSSCTYVLLMRLCICHITVIYAIKCYIIHYSKWNESFWRILKRQKFKIRNLR